MKKIAKNFENIKGYFLNDRKLMAFVNHRPENNCLEIIKEKILALDHTLIYLPGDSIDSIANRILSLGSGGLHNAGDLGLVDQIAGNLSIEKNFDLYNFASKYCCFHYPAFFPIYSISGIRVTNAFAKTNELPLHSSYEGYADLMMKFKSQSQLEELSFLEMNKFVWLYEDQLLNRFSIPGLLQEKQLVPA